MSFPWRPFVCSIVKSSNSKKSVPSFFFSSDETAIILSLYLQGCDKNPLEEVFYGQENDYFHPGAESYLRFGTYYVFLPILIPVIKHFGWDPMWFGVMMTVNLAIGTVTPPVALNLSLAANLAGISMERISRAALPCVLALIAALLVITYIPSLYLYLLSLFGLR